jgi:hypothetical protein
MAYGVLNAMLIFYFTHRHDVLIHAKYTWAHTEHPVIHLAGRRSSSVLVVLVVLSLPLDMPTFAVAKPRADKKNPCRYIGERS